MNKVEGKNGMRDIGVTRHACQRAVERLGADPEQAENYLKQLFQTAYYQGTTGSPGGRRRIYDHHKTGTRLIVSAGESKIITVYKMLVGLSKAAINGLDTSFLQPAMEREMRKIKRLYTRKIRAYELKHAESLREMADMVYNRARARNPNTRKLISERISKKQGEIQTSVDEIKRLSDEYKTKVRAIEVISG